MEAVEIAPIGCLTKLRPGLTKHQFQLAESHHQLNQVVGMCRCSRPFVSQIRQERCGCWYDVILQINSCHFHGTFSTSSCAIYSSVIMRLKRIRIRDAIRFRFQGLIQLSSQSLSTHFLTLQLVEFNNSDPIPLIFK